MHREITNPTSLFALLPVKKFFEFKFEVQLRVIENFLEQRRLAVSISERIGYPAHFLPSDMVHGYEPSLQARGHQDPGEY